MKYFEEVAMKRAIILVLVIVISLPLFINAEEFTLRNGIKWGIGLPPVFVPTSELVKTVSEVSPEKWSSLNEKNSGSKSPNLLRGWQKRLVSGMLVRCADGSNCSHFSTD